MEKIPAPVGNDLGKTVLSRKDLHGSLFRKGDDHIGGLAEKMEAPGRPVDAPVVGGAPETAGYEDGISPEGAKFLEEIHQKGGEANEVAAGAFKLSHAEMLRNWKVVDTDGTGS